jgi:hypothetical protein
MVLDNNAQPFLASGETGFVPKTARADCHVTRAATLSSFMEVFLSESFSKMWKGLCVD